MSSPAPLLRLDGVTKSFESVGRAGGATPVLTGVDLEVLAGESIAVLGPSGSGKSTLLNVIGTLEPPTTGSVAWEGRDLAALSPEELARFRNREIGFVFQRHHLLPQCSALENALVPALAGKGADLAAAEERARRLFDRVGLGERLAHRPAELSGGERQRVAVVRALVNGPRLLLADEPTGSLDEVSADGLAELLIELNEGEGVALVVVTHSRRLAERMGRRLVLQSGTLHEEQAVR